MWQVGRILPSTQIPQSYRKFMPHQRGLSIFNYYIYILFLDRM